MAIAEKVRIPHADAMALALEVVDLLQPTSERILIAGSLRRCIQMVGDIELLAVPRCYQELEPGLFEPVARTVNELDARCDQLRQEGILGARLDKNGRPAWGSRLKRAIYRPGLPGFALDLFVVIPPSQWGAQLVIRTGPADYSHQLVTPKGTRFKDSRGRVREGLLPPWLKVRDGGLYHGDELIETPTEEDFYRALGLAYVEPVRRS